MMDDDGWGLRRVVYEDTAWVSGERRAARVIHPSICKYMCTPPLSSARVGLPTLGGHDARVLEGAEDAHLWRGVIVCVCVCV